GPASTEPRRSGGGPEQTVKITILDKSGKTIRDLEGPKQMGINRINWDLRYATPAEPTPEQREAMAAGFFFGGARGPLVEPGTYTVKVALGKNEASKTVQVEEDPRITVSAADRAARHKALMDLYDMYKTADGGQKSVARLKTQLTSAMDSWKKLEAPKVPENVQKAAAALSRQVDEVHDKFVPEQRGQG